MEDEEVAKLQQEMVELDARVLALESERPRTDLLTKGFWGRAFGLWGYVLVAQLVVAVVVWLGLFLVGVFWGGGW
jgi:hypothetical protein